MWIIFKNHYNPDLTVVVDMDKAESFEDNFEGGTVIRFRSGSSAWVTDSTDQIIKALGSRGGMDRPRGQP